MVCMSFILLMSYRYMKSSSTTTSLFLLSRTPRMVVGNVSSHIVDLRCMNDLDVSPAAFA